MKKEGICNSWKLKIREVEDPDSVMTTFNLYKNGTVMVQGNLKQFELDFPLIKERAQQEKSTPTDNSHTLPATDTIPTTDQPPEENRPTNPEQAQDPQLNHTITDMKVKFTELERELVQLRELLSQQPTQNTTGHQDSCIINTELTKLKEDRDSYKRELTTLRTEVRELQQDRENHMILLTALTEEVRELIGERESYRRELTALSEEFQESGRATQALKEQLDSYPDNNQQRPIHTPQKEQLDPQPPQTNKAPHWTTNQTTPMENRSS